MAREEIHVYTNYLALEIYVCHGIILLFCFLWCIEMLKIIFTGTVFFATFEISVLHANLIVGPPARTGGDVIAEGFLRGLNNGIQQGLQEAQRRREQEEWLEAQKRAQEELAIEWQREQEYQSRKIQKEKENNIRIIEDILRDYDPSKNTEFVLKIIQSSLPEEQKKVIVECLDNQHKAYLLERNSRKNKFFGWLFKK